MTSVTDPEVLAFITRTQASYPDEANLASVEENRHFYNAMCDVFRQPRPDNVLVKDEHLTARNPERDIAVRHYRRTESPADTILLYSHGGGYVVGGLDSHDDVCAELCARTGCEVVSTDYRLAPEHLYPAQIDDVAAVYHSLLAHGKDIIVIGDSAGACLSAALCFRARREGWKQPAAQILIYPGLGGDMETLASYHDNAEAPLLRTVDVRYYSTVLTAGLPKPVESMPELAPLSATDYSNLAPALIVTADIDPLRDDGAAYCLELEKAGVPVLWRNEEQLVHGYLRGRHMSQRIAASFTAICTYIACMVQPSRPV